jgi:hypothetical protein
MMPQKYKNKILDGETDFDDSSDSTLPTDPTFPGLAGLSLLDVCKTLIYFSIKKKKRILF